MMYAQELFQTIEYPALMHCKSGADRAGIMSVLYRHFHLGEPIREAVKELSFRTMFERYLTEAEPQGIAFMDWVMSDAYDPVGMKKDFQAAWWGTLVSDRLLRRE